MISDSTMNLLIHIGQGAALFILGVIAIKLVMRILKKALDKSSVDEVVYHFIGNCIRIALYIVLGVVMLGYFDVPTTPVVTIIGAGGAAIALAIKDSLGNITSGLLILINKPFTKGDYIVVGGFEGTVEKTDLFNTTVTGANQTTIIIPNGVVTGSVLTNYSRDNKRYGNYQFSISYDADIAKAKEIIRKVAEDCPYSIESDKIRVGVVEHGADGVIIDLKVLCRTEEHLSLKQYIMENVKIAFDHANIEIPFNQVDVHIKEK